MFFGKTGLSLLDLDLDLLFEGRDLLLADFE